MYQIPIDRRTNASSIGLMSKMRATHRNVNSIDYAYPLALAAG